MNALVSIITPSFNSAKFIAETIQSVQNQTYQNWEMIIVDDGSSDETESVLLSIIQNDNRIQFYKLNQNLGPAVARNTGIEKASGDYMTFIDADDIWFPTFIENNIKTIQESGIPFVFSSYKRANEHLEFVYSDFIVPHKVSYSDILNTILAINSSYAMSSISKFSSRSISLQSLSSPHNTSRSISLSSQYLVIRSSIQSRIGTSAANTSGNVVGL
jgi:glycosyltransferase involved in cell wall biosynthesis